MANDNSGGCAGGILQLFAGIGMIFLTCARMGDDVMRCGSAASKFDDIGRTGSRVYYPKPGAKISPTYAKPLTFDPPAAAIPSSGADAITETATATVSAKRAPSPRLNDYQYNGMQAAKTALDLAKVAKHFDEEVENEPTSEVVSADLHAHLVGVFCESYTLRNPNFTPKEKNRITRMLREKTTVHNFLTAKAALLQIDKNIADLADNFPKGYNGRNLYQDAVMINVREVMRLHKKEINFSKLPLAPRDSPFGLLWLVKNSKNRLDADRYLR